MYHVNCAPVEMPACSGIPMSFSSSPMGQPAAVSVLLYLSARTPNLTSQCLFPLSFLCSECSEWCQLREMLIEVLLHEEMKEGLNTGVCQGAFGRWTAGEINGVCLAGFFVGESTFAPHVSCASNFVWV